MRSLSIEFLLLAAGVTIVYYLLPLSVRWVALLGGSALFALLSGRQSAAHLSAVALLMWGGALLLAYEYAPEKRKGFFGSIPQAGVTIGMLMATFIVSLMTLFSEEQFLSWGWRIPFLMSAVLVLLGLWIRKDIDETPEFKKVKQSGQVA